MSWRAIAIVAVLAGCDSEPTPYPTAKDTAGGADTTGDDAADPAVDAGGDAVADSGAPDAGPTELTCEELSVRFVEELSKHAGAWDSCTKDSQCSVLVKPKLECKTVGTTVTECAWAVSDPLAFATQKVAIEDLLCPTAPSGCSATPSCAPTADKGVCEGGHCKTKLVE